MNSRASPTLLLGLAIVLGASIAGIGWKWREKNLLQARLQSLRMENEELTQLRAENQRLRAHQIPAAQLEALRADHAALPRLRAEIEALKKKP